MQIKYSDPVVNSDGSINIEQIILINQDVLKNGIKRRELKVIQENYPDLELLKETISRARENYQNVELQGHKSVAQLEAEKSSLEELSKKVENL